MRKGVVEQTDRAPGSADRACNEERHLYDPLRDSIEDWTRILQECLVRQKRKSTIYEREELQHRWESCDPVLEICPRAARVFRVEKCTGRVLRARMCWCRYG